MNEGFTITVTEITQKEFLHAARRLGIRYFWGLIAMVFVVEFCITLITADFSTAAILAPIIMILIVPFLYEFFTRRDYKRVPKELLMEYYFDPKGWRIEANGESHVFAWSNTPKLKETGAVFLLYNTPTASNLVPKRLISAEQQQSIRDWFKNRDKLKKEKV